MQQPAGSILLMNNNNIDVYGKKTLHLSKKKKKKNLNSKGRASEYGQCSRMIQRKDKL
jgi:hypothetical protein